MLAQEDPYYLKWLGRNRIYYWSNDGLLLTGTSFISSIGSVCMGDLPAQYITHSSIDEDTHDNRLLLTRNRDERLLLELHGGQSLVVGRLVGS